METTSSVRKAYKKYLNSVMLSSSGEWCKVVSNGNNNHPEPYTIDEFMNVLISDDVFYEKWGDGCCEDLKYSERYKIWFDKNYETGMEYNEKIVPDFDNDYYEPTPKRKIATLLTEKYVDFVLREVIGDRMNVPLPSPQEDDKIMWVKLGPTVYMDVRLDIMERYSRSVSLRISFDKYAVEEIFFIPIESSPIKIKDNLYNKIKRLVYQTFLDDGRIADIKKMYEEKTKELFNSIGHIISKFDDQKKSTRE